MIMGVVVIAIVGVIIGITMNKDTPASECATEGDCKDNGHHWVAAVAASCTNSADDQWKVSDKWDGKEASCEAEGGDTWKAAVEEDCIEMDTWNRSQAKTADDCGKIDGSKWNEAVAASCKDKDGNAVAGWTAAADVDGATCKETTDNTYTAASAAECVEGTDDAAADADTK